MSRIEQITSQENPVDLKSNHDQNGSISEEVQNDSEFFIRNTFQTDSKKGCELLFRLYFKPMCSYAVGFVLSKEIAEDIVSDIFFNFWKNQSFHQVSTSYRGYLFRSVRNRSYNYLAKELNKTDSLSDNNVRDFAQNETPLYIMQIDELQVRINNIIGSLGPQCQKVFLMNRLEGRANKEIAGELNLSVRTVETHVFKAISTLRKGLRDYWISTIALLCAVYYS